MSISEDDALYSALLAQLLSDSATTRNARVHSWIEHQYDFVLAEQPSSRPPSPSPSSSLGAQRTCCIDRPDSPLLPRPSSERPISPCPSYDALFKSNDDDFEEQERVRALRFIVQEMAHWKSHVTTPPSDKPLPAPPPSPASSLTQSTSSRVLRSRSSSTCISRLPSFTSTLSSDQSHPKEILPPLPVSVIVHGELQHELVLARDCPLIDGYLHKHNDSFSHSLLSSSEQDTQYLCPIPDDVDSALQPSPTFSSFSYAHSRDTSFTTPYTSSPASPTSVIFAPSPCPPESVALPSSPVDDVQFSVHRPALSHKSSESVVRLSSSLTSHPISPPTTNVFPASPVTSCFMEATPDADTAPYNLRAPKSIEFSQSRWSIATTASLTPSTAEPRSSHLLTPPQDKKDKRSKTPRKRTRFISLISRLSPARPDPSSTTTTQTDDVDYDSGNDSASEDKNKPRKTLSKKSSLASIRVSFSISRPSFNSQRPPLSSPTEEIPPLPTSPTVSSPLADPVVPLEVASPLSRSMLSKIPSRANLVNTPLPPIPQSASAIGSFPSSSRISISDTFGESHGSRNACGNMSRVSQLPAPSKRSSLASAAGIEMMTVSNPLPASQVTVRPKSIFRLTAKPKSLKTPATTGAKATTSSSKLPLSGSTSLPSPTTVRSRIPQAPAKFIPPAKLATVITAQSRHVPSLVSRGPAPPTSKLPTPPSRIPPKVPRSVTITEKSPVDVLPPSSRLPMPASVKSTRVGTVKGFWKRQ